MFCTQESTKSQREPKMSQKGTKRTKSRRWHCLSLPTRAAHTPVSFEGVDQGFHSSHGLAIDPHGCVQFNRSNMAWQSHHTALSHGRVPTEPKLSPIRKRPLWRVSRHSKAYKYALEEEKMGDREEGKELPQGSRLIHLRSRIHLQDWRSPFNSLQEFLGFLYVLLSLFFWDVFFHKYELNPLNT